MTHFDLLMPSSDEAKQELERVKAELRGHGIAEKDVVPSSLFLMGLLWHKTPAPRIDVEAFYYTAIKMIKQYGATPTVFIVLTRIWTEGK
jgi:hypothetical protein